MVLGKHARGLAKTLAVIVCCCLAFTTQAEQTGDNPSIEQQWFDAALFGDVERMASAIEGGMDVDQKDASGATALITASLSGESEVVRFLLERGADTDRRAATGATPLMVAAWQGHLEAVQLLLSAGSDANAATSSNGATALIFAAQEGHIGVVKALLASGADVDAQASNGTSALMAATKDGHLETVRALLRSGADISLQKRNGASAMTLAASNSQGEVSDLLVYFATNDQLPPYPKAAPPEPAVLGASLIASARIGDEVGVRSLLERDAPINHRNDSSETALIVAAEGGHLATLQILLKADPDLETARAKDGATALAIAAGSGHFDVARALLYGGSYVDATLGNTRFTEHAASTTGEAASQALPKTKVRRAAQETPLMLAILNGHNDVAVLLLEHGADPDRRDAFGEPPLMAATRLENASTAGALLAAGAQPEAQNESGETALSIAVQAEDWTLVSMLIESGADPNALDDDLSAALQAFQRTEVATLPRASDTEPPGGNGVLASSNNAANSTDAALRSVPENVAAREIPKTALQLEPKPTTPDPKGSGHATGSDQARSAADFDSDDRETIKHIQAMLNEAGFSAGPADGLIGKRTRNAIRKYESEIGLEETGEISEKVFQRLQMETNG